MSNITAVEALPPQQEKLMCDWVSNSQHEPGDPRKDADSNEAARDIGLTYDQVDGFWMQVEFGERCWGCGVLGGKGDMDCCASGIDS